MNTNVVLEGAAPRRLDIQGLRAVAVLAVIAFHAGLPAPGGFLGVDVFFVISGFVITAMLNREWSATGELSLGRFYLRRLKRLAPALAVMVAASTVLAGVIYFPAGPSPEALITGMGAMLLSANGVIALSTGGYFDPPAEANPFLHTWSLSVEEQFYLFFPLLLFAAWKTRRRKTNRMDIVVVALVAATSILAMLTVDSERSWRAVYVGFYGAAGRAWEFAVGSLLSLTIVRLKGTPGWVANLLGSLGLIGTFASFAFLTREHTTPGYTTFLPVVSTALLIACGSNRSSAISRSLSHPALVRIGDWSYSLYLWHWPFIVFAKVLWPMIPTWGLVLAAALSAGPALASYAWIEQPIRNSQLLGWKPICRLATWVVAAPIVIATLTIPAVRLVAPPVTLEGHDEFYRKVRTQWRQCPTAIAQLVREEWPQGTKRCFTSLPSESYDIVLFGDSHAEQLFPGLARALPAKNILVLIDGSPPFIGNGIFQPMIEFVRGNPDVHAVVYAAQWENRLAATDAWQQALAETVAALATPERKVVMLEDNPTFSFPPERCAEGVLLGWSGCSENVAGQAVEYMPYFRELAASADNVEAVSIRGLFCTAAICRMNPSGPLLYRDPNHLNFAGSEYVAKVLMPYLASSAP